jgi:hypoxanthine phosphoribosyltransferase
MKNDIQEILLSEEKIALKIKEIGKAISEDYVGKNLLVIGVLKGSVIFVSDLIRSISIPCEIDFMSVSSYGASSESSGIVRIIKDLDYSIEGKDVIIAEDIIDSGITLEYLVNFLKGRNAKSIEIAALLSKPARRKVNIDAKYIGYEVPDEFLVGYGLDYANRYRNLPFVGVLKRSVYEK